MNSAHSPMEPQKSSMTRSIFRTLFMPEIKLSFGTTGMTHRAFLSILATMFIQAGLLPYNHPARSMETIGSTSFRSIMGEAWYNLRNSGKNDFHQYGLFFAVFLLIAMAIMMVMTFAGQLFVSTASAQIPGGLFSSPAPDTDLGLSLIEHLIGAASRGEGGVHGASLGKLFSIYSYGVLVIASFIVAWSVISIVVDTAATGKFFGGRHNPVWWPIRLVFGLALLVPLGHGFNAGQYMVIQIAKWGSNLASNAWYVYVEAVITDGTRSYIANQYPTAQVFSDFKDIAKIQLCRAATNHVLKKKLNQDPSGHKRYIIQYPPIGNISSGQVKVAFGEQGDNSGGFNLFSPDSWGVDEDKCGIITLRAPADEINETFTGDPNESDWSFVTLANKLLNSSSAIDTRFADTYSTLYFDVNEKAAIIADAFVNTYFTSSDNRAQFDAGQVNVSLEDIYDRYTVYFNDMETKVDELTAASNSKIQEVVGEVKQYGWPAASLWYYIISSANQTLDENLKASATIDVGYFDGRKRRQTRRGKRIDRSEPDDLESQNMYIEFENWWEGQVNSLQIHIDTKASPSPSEEALSDEIGSKNTRIEGEPQGGEEFTSEIFDKMEMSNIITRFVKEVRHAGMDGADSVHPIVLMSDIGAKMITYAERIVMAGFVVSAGTAIGGAFASLHVVPSAWTVALAALSEIGAVLAGIIFLIVGPLIIGGVILSIILPMTPFIRFVFAISGWMIAIIEAVVMVPIVALGHLRTDGEGIMGPMVQGAYVMMLQLLLRPVLIVIGLVLSMFLVEVTVNYVNYTFFAMLDSIPLGDSSGSLFLNSLIRFVGFGVMYGVLMYGLINSSFKLVDLLPEAVVKYLGGSPSGGITDRDEGDLNRAVLASAVFASGISSPVRGGQFHNPQEKKPTAGAKSGKNNNNNGNP